MTKCWFAADVSLFFAGEEEDIKADKEIHKRA
jgi:hypothetical protein